MKKDVIVVDGFYEEPEQVREFALQELKSNSYFPYGPTDWIATRFKEWHQCPFKSSYALISALSELTSEQVDLDFWRMSYPEHGSEGTQTPG